ncbi:hypothetical protein T265_05279 [Opisthorchis viverrini]|uniref:Uncharacterized protein n=1 Tax=Opisthorchis viverrini TaxID=6198 RepID=A0A074ZL05_OPIVI|nr:hypothetical protein T265_05279 [Opisthorchis viverrini]KER27721.1 hypothetical protein T265_05279 [Opisthorchis viverrini]
MASCMARAKLPTVTDREASPTIPRAAQHAVALSQATRSAPLTEPFNRQRDEIQASLSQTSSHWDRSASGKVCWCRSDFTEAIDLTARHSYESRINQHRNELEIQLNLSEPAYLRYPIPLDFKTIGDFEQTNRPTPGAVEPKKKP